MMRIKRGAALMLTLFCWQASPARAAEPAVVHAGYGGIAGYQLPLWVNKEIGISRKYGIELEPLLIGGGALNMQALVSGSIQFSQNSASSAIQPALRGRHLVAGAIAARGGAVRDPRISRTRHAVSIRCPTRN